MLKTILKPFSSLTLTVILLGFLLLWAELAVGIFGG